MLQLKPVPDVYRSALEDVLQLGMDTADGEADDPVEFARTVFAATVERPPTGTPPHAGDVDGPVETITCPVDEPAGFSNVTGTVVAASAATERSAASAPIMLRFIAKIPLFQNQCLSLLASIAEIAEVLRHRSQDSTAIYAKVAFEDLRGVVRSWPTAGGAI